MTLASTPARASVTTGAQGRSTGWWGAVTLVLTEATFFALLLFTYFYLWGQTDAWPPSGVRDPELLRSGLRTGLLMASSATLVWAERGLRSDRQGRLLLGLAVTGLLAVVFLAGHAHETAALEFSWRDHAYGSLWYVITNIHAAHLVVGVGLLMFTFAAARRGAFRGGRLVPLRTASMYWHFVDAVWIAVYTSLYVLPNIRAGGSP